MMICLPEWHIVVLYFSVILDDYHRNPNEKFLSKHADRLCFDKVLFSCVRVCSILLPGVAQGSKWAEKSKKDGAAFHWCGVIEPGQLSD